MMSVFDDLLFGSTLGPRLCLCFAEILHTNKHLYENVDGNYVMGDGWGLIEICRNTDPGVTHMQKLWHYTQTLLHEMVHVSVVS
jgi:hypothetical protein